MFPRALWIAFLTLSLSSFTVDAVPASQDANRFPSPFNFGQGQNQNQNCGPGQVKTVTQTQTVTVTKGAVATPPPSNNNSNNGNNGNNNNNGGKGNTGNGGKNNNNNGNSGVKGNAGNNGGTNGGKGNNNDNGNNGGKGGTATTKATTTAKATATSKSTTVRGVTLTTTASGSTNTGTNNNGAGNNNANSDPQKSFTLDPKVIAKGFADDGQDVPTAGQVPSLTSTNNFINFCLTVPNLPITDGKQITTGSCNPAPIGSIPSTDNMPSAKFVFPANFGTVKANTAFTIQMAIQNIQTGFFVNAQENYFAAPQQLNAQGQIQGHSHVVIETLSAIDQTTPTDPKKFAFFKGLNGAAVNGQLTADVTAGLPTGFYKLASINTAANHQPAIVPVAQHGSLDDAIYFTVTEDGKPLSGSIGADTPSSSNVASSATQVASASAGTQAAPASAANSAAATGKTTATGKATATAKAASTGKATVPTAAASSAVAPGKKAPATPTQTPEANNNGKGVNNGNGKGASNSVATNTNGIPKGQTNAQNSRN